MKRPGDKTPPPPGGRAGARLRLFQQQRQPAGAPPETKPAARVRKTARKNARTKTGGSKKR